MARSYGYRITHGEKLAVVRELTEALRRHDGRIDPTATELAVHRATLARLVRSLGLDRATAAMRRRAGVPGPRHPRER